MRSQLATLVFVCCVLSSAAAVRAQSFEVELFNNVMPASGGMAGASIALPQGLLSAINGNPATLTQYRGTQYGFSGAWIEPTYNLSVESYWIGSGITGRFGRGACGDCGGN